jgi:predicted RNase H-like HicB family nuclease
MPKREVKLKGNTFKYVYYKTSNYEPDETGYCAFVPLFKGCATQAETLTELDKNVKLAIKDWLEPTTLNVVERQRLESLERLVRSKDYFYTAMADNVSEEWIEKGVEKFLESKKIEHGITFVCSTDTLVREAIKAGIQYALKALSKGGVL